MHAKKIRKIIDKALDAGVPEIKLRLYEHCFDKTTDICRN